MNELPDIIRAPNHVGDLVMSMPALLAAPAADVVIPRPFVPLLQLCARSGAAIPFRRGQRGLLDAVRSIRRGRYERGVVLTRSFSSAAMFRLGGVRQVRGINTDGRGFLLSERVDPAIMPGRSRPAAYFELVTGERPDEVPIPRLPVDEAQCSAFRHATGLGDERLIGIFPGSNASARRWDPRRFAETARELTSHGRVVVFGGPGEVDLTREVAGDWAADLGGRTDLAMLAAGLAACDLLVTNDSGPLHIAAAVGTRTVSLWGAGDPRETGVVGAAHALLRHPELPCVPCVKNECPRHGRGYILPEAERECLQLIAVPDVVSAARTMVAP